MQAVEIGSDKPARKWCVWSTTESIQNDVPSVTAIIETLIAVPLYWWIALQVGMLPSLLIGVAVAPFVLLRSEESVALGIKWFLAFEQIYPERKTREDLSGSDWGLLCTIALAGIVISVIAVLHILDRDALNSDSSFWFITPTSVFTFVLFLLVAFSVIIVVSVVISPFCPIFGFLFNLIDKESTAHTARSYLFVVFMITALFPCIMMGILAVTIGIRVAATVCHLRSGIQALPRNFRRLTVCTSPIQTPEIIPDIESTDSKFRFRTVTGDLSVQNLGDMLIFANFAILFLPAWLYRLTIKSTAWF